MTILEIAQYNLGTAKGNLVLRQGKLAQAPMDRFAQLDVIECEEDITKWERVVSRLKELSPRPGDREEPGF